MTILLVVFLVIFPLPAKADIFVRGASTNDALREVLAKDRAGYYYHSPGLDTRQTQKKVSDLDSLSSGTLTRDRGLYDVDGAFRKEFDESFSKDGSFDRYRAARNQLLLLEYSSPALADVIKHYRVMTAQRVALEQQRFADIEETTRSPLDRLRMLSERECLRGKQGEGLVSAMEQCKKDSQPFDALPLLNGQGSLADGRRNIHVVRDAVALLGVLEKDIPDKVAALSGEVIVTDDDYQEVLPKETFAGRVEYYRQKIALKWKDALEKRARGESIGQSIPELALPGVPVTEEVFKSLLVLDGSSRGIAVVKLSALLARAQALNEYGDALMYLEHARQVPQLPEEFRKVLSARAEYVNAVVAHSESAAGVSEQYRVMLAGLLSDADTARAGLLAGGTRNPDTAGIAPASLMVSF